jgi:predicted RNA-binding Zn ribbon-like protein
MDTSATPTHDPQREYVFDLDAGIVCLDFVNTLSASSGEHLNDYADLLSFARQSHLLTPSEADRLQRRAGRRPDMARRTLADAKQLRKALFEVFRAAAEDRPPSANDLAVLNAQLAVAMAHACISRSDDGFEWGWSGADLDRVVWPIVRSAADLLTSDSERPTVRECGAADCLWLFLDTSKNRSRQWCSMSSCGNREKARRHYQRVRAKRTAASG